MKRQADQELSMKPRKVDITNSKGVSPMRFAFLCDTPYQVFGAVNFVANDMEESCGRSDICIYRQFTNADIISERLKEIGLFHHVYDFKPYRNNKAWYTKIRTLWRIGFPERVPKAHELGKTGFCDQRYQHLVMFFFTHFTLSCHQINADAEVLLLEDGTGSYFGNMEQDYRSGLFSFFNRFFMNGALDYHPQRLYINNPALCKSTIAEEIRQLPRLDAQNPALPLLETIFGYRGNPAVADKKVIYLTQPLNEVKGYIAGRHEAVVGMLAQYRVNVLLRVHPRQKDVFMGGLTVDDANNLWELECIRHITDEHVLVGAFSTAQLAPKLLCDKEPYLVFTYKLFFDNTDSDQWCGAASLIERFKSMYRQSGKLFVPETMDELRGILDQLAGKH